MAFPIPRALPALLLAAALAAPASAGVVMSLTTQDPGRAPSNGKVQIEGSNIRVESEGTLAIFRGDRDVLWVLEPKAKSYTEITKKDAEGVASALGQVQAQLAQLPPEQRAMVEQMMASRMKGMAPPAAAAAPSEPVRVVPTGANATISGFPTTSHDVFRGAKKEAEAWIAPWSAVGVGASDFAGMTELAEFVKSMAGPGAGFADAAGLDGFAQPDAYPGLPIRTVTGQAVHEITELRRADVPATAFEMPAGLTKSSLADQMPGR